MKDILFEKGTTDEFVSIVVDAIRSEFKNLPKAPDQKPKVYGTRMEVAKALHISLPTLNELTKTGILTGYRLQGRVLYKWIEIDQALKKIESVKYPRTQ